MLTHTIACVLFLKRPLESTEDFPSFRINLLITAILKSSKILLCLSSKRTETVENCTWKMARQVSVRNVSVHLTHKHTPHCWLRLTMFFCFFLYGCQEVREVLAWIAPVPSRVKPSTNSLLEWSSCCVAEARLIVSDKRLNMLQRTGNNPQSSAS